ncbi:MAG: MotA/TolQ/ExbB proton channel family protein [Verrucomicrobiia bacterium]|jgi:biopolymer transport protein ExbB
MSERRKLLKSLRGLFAALLCLFAAATAAAQSLEDLAAKQQTKLDDAVKRLAEQRKEIEAEQIPLARELNDLTAKARDLRKQLNETRAIRDSRGISLEQLQSRVEAREKELDYITRSLFSEFISASQSALSAGEHATHGEAIRQHNLFLESPEATDAEKIAASLKLISDSTARLEKLIGGKSYDGSALSQDGSLEPGRFVQVGPLLYFAGQKPEIAGWVSETKALQPKVQSLDSELAAQTTDVANNGEGMLPIDATLGDAIAIAETNESLGQHLKKGGVWVYPIVGFALIASIAALFKLIQIFSIRQPRPMVVHEIVKLLRDGRKDDARALAESQPGPSSEMLVAAVDNAGESIELVEEVMYESMLNTQPKLERFLNVIAVTAATAPLLGLLGTVTGIIKTFKLMKVFGAGDPKPLISGISEALITTELGLVLAIPALVIHALLSRRVAGVLARMEKLSVAFVNGLSRRQTTAAPAKKEVANAD